MAAAPPPPPPKPQKKNNKPTRIQIEIQELMKSDFKKCGYKIIVDESNFTELKGEIMRPEGTPYETRHFIANFTLPTEYPFKPPKVKFDTRVWHPNVSSVTGCICLDVLKSKWTVALNIRTILLSLQALLSTPEAGDPLDGIVGGQYRRNKDLFDKTAQYWKHVYANGEKGKDEFEKKELQLLPLGFQIEEVRQHLSQCDWDVSNAKKHLLSGKK